MKKVCFVLSVLLIVLTGCNSVEKNVESNSIGDSVVCSNKEVTNNSKDDDSDKDKKLNDQRQISKYPKPAEAYYGKLEILPEYDENSDDVWYQVDLRGYDLSDLSISDDRLNDLMHANFDSYTVWPENLPNEFNPQEIMERGKNPGLNIKKLHEKGITGKGISIAIIDYALLVNHDEYKDNLKLYEEINWPNDKAQLHGPAVASLAVGKNCGVAPDADLYFICERSFNIDENGKIQKDFTWLAKAINRVLEINKTLPSDKKIKAISISSEWFQGEKGYEEAVQAIDNAKESGIFVVSCNLLNTYGFCFNGLGRFPLDNPEKVVSYKPGEFWAKFYYEGTYNEFLEERYNNKINEVLMVPMDSRTVASATGDHDYTFYASGGWSWCMPYIAGVYALACQVNPEITPEQFWSEALKTGDVINVEHEDKQYEFGKIINPEKLIESIANMK